MASQKLTVFAFDYSTGAPKTGDAANLTCYVSKDDGAVTVLGDTTATELDATNAKGSYSFDLTQAETNADKLVFTGKSATANIAVVAQTIYTVPAAFTSLAIANNAVDANVTRYGGTAGAFSGGRPEVNTSHWGGSTTPVTNLNTVFNTDFATNYNTTNDGWVVKLGNYDHGGTSATLRLGASSSTPAFYVTNDAGDAVQFESTSGIGFDVVGGAISNPGMRISAGNGPGMSISSGGTVWAGLQVSASSSAAAVSFSGAGVGAGLLLSGGSTGPGLRVVGGATSGNGINILTTDGHGIDIAPVGSSKHGINVTGGNGGTSDGMRLVAGTGGVGFRIDTMTVTTNAIAWNTAWDAEVESEVTDALTAALTEGYRGTNATGSVRDLLYELIAHMGESVIATTTKTLKKLDGSTTAKTYTLNSATTPTSITEAT